jgi:hypothetical protein
MIIRGVEIPEQLILDQRAGKLVIFAGAGISLDRPSSLPDFVELTEAIVCRKLKNHEKSKLDHVLGTYGQAGVNVHKAAKEILDRPDSRPTILHKSLLSLFPESMSVRVVTTNFDRHFSNATRELFTELPEEYYAPALPLGNDFKGIVYLHGSLERDEKRFVMTDTDFGRAYLTEGWATRFLWALFREYTVLFVGYSHNDPVMHYLSKGLPTETIGKRYALTPENDACRWKSLDITPLPYPIHRKRHKALTVAVTAWANLSAMGALDYEHRIKEILTGSTHLSEEDTSFILYSLKHTSYARFFGKYAERIDWLHWAEANNLLKPLFQHLAIEDNLYAILADWIVEKYLVSNSDAILALILRQGQHLNPVLWDFIARKLHSGNPRIEPRILASIVPILLKSAHPRNHIDQLSYLLSACNAQEDVVSALLLFEHLSSPQIDLQRNFSMASDEHVTVPRIEIDVLGDDYWLREAWEKVFAPNMTIFANKLEIISARHLLVADELLKSYGGPDYFDSVSYSRSAIEPHQQDQYPRKLDVLIDAARDSIEFLVRNEPEAAIHFINKWYGVGPEIMKRIAMHTLAECSAIAADEKITWLLDRGLLFNIGCVHEVFRVLKAAYPHANVETRKKLIQTIKRGFKGEGAARLDKETKNYEVYNLLYWIRSADSSCPLAKIAFQSFQKAHPKFQPREHPDFHHWSGGAEWVGHKSPVTLDALISKKPADQLEFLLTYKGSIFDGPDRGGLLNLVVQAVQQNFEWGINLSKALISEKAWDTDLWDHILRGWEEGPEGDNDLVTVLQLLINSPELFKHGYRISNLIQKRFSEKKETSEEALALAMRIAEMQFDYLESCQEEETETSNDWLQRSINHAGGKLAEFWLHVLSRERKTADDAWVGILEVPRRCLEKMISGTSQESQFAKVFISSQFYFMFYLDAPWAIRHVLPLLDWSVPERARQCWDGYLFWGRYGENTLPHVMPYYRSTFRLLNTLPDEQRRRFCEHMASIAVYSSINPLEDGWLNEFITVIEEKDRVEWARQFEHILRGVKDDAAKLLWEQWLGKYWHRRNLGQPVPLSPAESREMVKWSSCLGSVFDKAVKMICELPAPEVEDTYMFDLMNEKIFASLHTEQMANLLIHLIPKMTKSWLCHELVPLARALRDAGLDSRLFAKIQDALVVLGCVETI